MKSLIVTCLMLVLLGCARTRDTEQTKRSFDGEPIQKADGGKTDVVDLQFRRMVTKSADQGRAAEILVSNYFSKPIRDLKLQLDYLDKDNRKVGGFPWGVSAVPSFLGPGEAVNQVMGFRIPPEAVTVHVKLERVRFTDGTEVEYE